MWKYFDFLIGAQTSAHFRKCVIRGDIFVFHVNDAGDWDFRIKAHGHWIKL